MFNRRRAAVPDQTPPVPTPTGPMDGKIYKHELATLIEHLLNSRPASRDYTFYRTKIRTSLTNILTEATEIDFDNLTMDEQRQLGNILTVDLPQAKRRVDLNTKQHTWVGHSKLILPITDPAGRNLLTLKLGQQDRARAQAINLTPDTTWQQLAITGNTDDETTLKSVSFPTFTSSDVRLQNAYEALRDTWAQAGVKNLTIEDAYTITAIAADYLPDSIRMYQRLAHRSSLAAEQGATLLLEHFNLLQKQVDAILARETGNALADMHAQTRFLTGKTGQPTL